MNNDNVAVREVFFDSKKGGKEITIGQITDIHINLLNDQDMLDEELAETQKHRFWLKNGESIPNTNRSLDYCKDFDLTVITGDILDYASNAARDFVRDNIFNKKNVLACVGGHDLTKQMETAGENKTSLQERYGFLEDFWCNDIQYASKTLDNRVKIVVFNNNTELWREHREPMDEKQYKLLLADIEDARKNDLIMLLFCHEPIFTGVPDQKIVTLAGEEKIMSTAFENCDEISQKAYKLITSSSDVIKGVFCGHRHYDTETEILAYYEKDGKTVDQNIRQYVLTSNAYGEKGHVLKITVK